MQSYFLTVAWCKGRRGIFCDKEGNPFRKDDEPHTEQEMFGVLGPFVIILSPRSQVLTEEEVAEYTQFGALAEYKNEYGIALRPLGEYVTEPKPSAIYYGVICKALCGPVELTRENYDWQMNRPNAEWACPNCGGPADWDDVRHDASMEAQYDRTVRNDRRGSPRRN